MRIPDKSVYYLCPWCDETFNAYHLHGAAKVKSGCLEKEVFTRHYEICRAEFDRKQRRKKIEDENNRIVSCDVCGDSRMTGGFLIDGIMTCAKEACIIEAFKKGDQNENN